MPVSTDRPQRPLEKNINDVINGQALPLAKRSIDQWRPRTWGITKFLRGNKFVILGAALVTGGGLWLSESWRRHRETKGGGKTRIMDRIKDIMNLKGPRFSPLWFSNTFRIIRTSLNTDEKMGNHCHIGRGKLKIHSKVCTRADWVEQNLDLKRASWEISIYIVQRERFTWLGYSPAHPLPEQRYRQLFGRFFLFSSTVYGEHSWVFNTRKYRRTCRIPLGWRALSNSSRDLFWEFD